MSGNTHEITSGRSIVILTASASGAGSEQGAQPAKAMKFSAESDASHSGTTNVDIEAKVGSVWVSMGTLSVTGASDGDYFLVDGVLGHFRANCTSHGDSTNNVSVRVEW